MDMQNTPFNLVTTIAVLQKQWKIILLFVITTVLAATMTVFLVPPYFKSSATIVSANPLLADKAKLFNGNIKDLYSYFGNGDDLDRIDGIAGMDTTYAQLVDEFSMISYYALSGDSIPVLRKKATKLLRKDISIQKTEQGQLKIIVYTKNSQLSANLVNRMVAILQEKEIGIWKKNYQSSLATLATVIDEKESEYHRLSDSLSSATAAKRDLLAAKMQTFLEEIKEYHKAADEFKLVIAAPPAVLYVMEAAVPSASADKPDKPAVILAAAIISFIFSCLLVLINNRNKTA